MIKGWALVEYFARVLPPEVREPVLGDLLEADESAWKALRGLLGLVVLRQVELWRSWRPWFAGFGVALPYTSLLMGVSLTVSWSYMRLLCPELLAQASLTKPSALLHLLGQALLLIGWSWTSGFVVGSVSKRTLWASTLLCYAPCLVCLSQFRPGSMSRFSLFLFVLPAVWGAHRGFRVSRIKFSSALLMAIVLTLNLSLSIPAWYLVFTAWKRRHEPLVEHAA
jgi:hypothetical protein